MSIFESVPARENGRERSVKLTWELGETTDHGGQPATAMALLFVSHDKDRKSFMAVAHRMDVAYEGDFKVEKFMVTGGARVRLASVPCARYSAKALEAAVDAALAELRSRVDEPAVKALADPATPA